MIRVLIADDMSTMRELLVAVLDADPGIEIVGVAKNGREAIEMTRRLRPDVIAMDTHMPEVDGFEATKKIMIEAPTPIVIVSGSMEARNVNVSMNALRAGALALLAKPPGVNAPNFQEVIVHLTATIKAMAGVKVVRHRQPRAPSSSTHAANLLRPLHLSVIAIVASTGGPAALARILGDLPAQFPVPILIVQHISSGFVNGLVAWLNTVCSLNVKVATNGDPLVASTVYLAGDGAHLGVGADFKVKLDHAGPIGGFRPSATHLFKSVASVFGSSAVALLLTGMGQDGVDGLRDVRGAGGGVLAQDEASSIVFGIPGTAIAQGLVDEVLPLAAIGERLTKMTANKRVTPNGEEGRG
jgi:two-component system chemotaxis response regulator CheB